MGGILYIRKMNTGDRRLTPTPLQERLTNDPHTEIVTIWFALSFICDISLRVNSPNGTHSADSCGSFVPPITPISTSCWKDGFYLTCSFSGGGFGGGRGRIFGWELDSAFDHVDILKIPDQSFKRYDVRVWKRRANWPCLRAIYNKRNPDNKKYIYSKHHGF